MIHIHVINVVITTAFVMTMMIAIVVFASVIIVIIGMLVTSIVATYVCGCDFVLSIRFSDLLCETPALCGRMRFDKPEVPRNPK